MSTKSSLSNNSENTNSSETNEYDDRQIDWSYQYINEYLLINKLGKGAYCSVWFAYNYEKNIYCALKIYSREDLKKGHNEIKVYDNLKNINMNNLVLYKNSFEYIDDTEEYDDYDKYGNTFLCTEMPLCGYSIYDLIEIFENNIPVDFVYKIIKRLIFILDELHKNNYVHSDIKPENILLKQTTYENYQIINIINNIKNKKYSKINKKNKDEFVKIIKKTLENKVLDDSNENIKNYIIEKYNDIMLCDMGTTVRPGDPNLYKKYTIYYKAPETILRLNYNCRYDYWSLGCSLFEILTGNILFDVDNDLELLYEFTSKLGPIPKEILQISDIKTMYYNKNLSRLRGYNKIIYTSLYEQLCKLINDDNYIIMRKLINIIISSLDYNYLTRKINEDYI